MDGMNVCIEQHNGDSREDFQREPLLGKKCFDIFMDCE